MLESGAPIDWDSIISTSSPITSGIVSAAPYAGIPTPNCFKVNGDGTGVGVRARNVRINAEEIHWPLPNPGKLFWRFYRHVVYPTPTYPTLGNNNHPIEGVVSGGPSGGGNAVWEWSDDIVDAGWRPKWESLSSVPNRYFLSAGNQSVPIFLARNATYRFEWAINIAAGMGTYTVEIRIYDSAGTLLYTEADFFNSSTALTGQVMTIPAANRPNVAGGQFGTNGPLIGAFAPDPIDPMWIIAAVCARTDDWCGPWNALDH